MDFLRHETMHVFLANKFPKAGRMVDRSFVFEVPFKIDVGGGFVVDMSGVYPPVMFHELCGIGIQIAQSDSDVPYSILTYLGYETDGSYKLVGKILPLAILKVAPETPLKKQIMDGFYSDGTLDFPTLERLVKSPEFTPEHSKAVGNYLFTAGVQLLDMAENTVK